MPIEIVKKAFEEIGCTMGQVGAELGREQRLDISYQDFLRLQDALAAISFVDAADIFWRSSMVKSDTEIAILTEACKIQDFIFYTAFEAVETGMTTREITNLFQRFSIKSDAEFGWVVVCIGHFDPRQAAGSSQPDLRLKSGDLLWVDLGVVMHGYHTDYCRGMVPGYVEKFINTKIGPVPVIKTRLGRDDLFATFYVWCAAGKGTFSTQELVKRNIENHLDRIVRHKRVIVPRLGATGVSAFDVKKQSRFRVIYGPVRASDHLSSR